MSGAAVLWWLSWAALVGHLLSIAALWFNHRNTVDVERAPLPGEADGAGASLCVLVPARNEEANIAACVESLCASTWPGLRIRVVDDGSTDRTGAIVRAIAGRDARVEVIDGQPLPPGWLGKSYALHVGVRGVDAEYLLFVDADLRVAPACLERAMAAAARTDADLLTMIPRVEAVGFWERAVQPLMAQLIYGWMPAREINDPRHRRAGAIGPFMLFRRAAYERIGGHETVRAEVVEDLRLAEAIKRAGLRLVLARGVHLADLRMYDSLGAIVRGWSKNFHVALGEARWAAPLVAAGIFFYFAGPWLLPAAALAAAGVLPAHAIPMRGIAVAAAALGAAVAGRVDLSRRYGVTLRGVWLMPVGAAVIAYIVVRSAFRAATGRGFNWKDRTV